MKKKLIVIIAVVIVAALLITLKTCAFQRCTNEYTGYELTANESSARLEINGWIYKKLFSHEIIKANIMLDSDSTTLDTSVSGAVLPVPDHKGIRYAVVDIYDAELNAYCTWKIYFSNDSKAVYMKSAEKERAFVFCSEDMELDDCLTLFDGLIEK